MENNDTLQPDDLVYGMKNIVPFQSSNDETFILEIQAVPVLNDQGRIVSDSSGEPKNFYFAFRSRELAATQLQKIVAALQKSPKERGIRFMPVRGSLIGGMQQDKMARIKGAMADLRLGIDGLNSQLSGACDGNQRVHVLDSFASFARLCSVFLRKTVLGDHDRRETRLLDDSILKSVGLQFDRLRKIPQDRRREIEVGFGCTEMVMEVTKLDDDTLEPQEINQFSAGPHEVKIFIEWPLPGTADWTGVPSKETAWPVSADQLFHTGAGSGLSCDDWLGQQVVMFDGKGVSLKEMIRTVANFEGAHSIDVGRLAAVEGEQAFRAAMKPAPHILNAITICGIRYAHLIVIECALYLYEKLLERLSEDPYKVVMRLACLPEQPQSSRPDWWIEYKGGMMVSFSDGPKIVKHKIRAVS